MEGLGLLRALIEATGLPQEAVDREINRLCQAHNLTPEHITLDDLRDILAHYLQDVLVEAKATY
jgi:hypothetical protein